MKLEEALKTEKFASEKQKAVLNILYSAWWLKTTISKELKTLGLTHEQFNVLRILKGKHPEALCVRDIGGRMIERNSNVPRIVDKLIAKNLVVRANSEVDKRETVISLTLVGLGILEEASQKVQSLIDHQFLLKQGDDEKLNIILDNCRSEG